MIRHGTVQRHAPSRLVSVRAISDPFKGPKCALDAQCAGAHVLVNARSHGAAEHHPLLELLPRCFRPASRQLGLRISAM